MSGRSSEDYEDDYTEPELRARLKDEIQAGDRGGRPGQWSARKSQLLVAEYERNGGGYRHEGRRTRSQRHLEEWTGQDWRTADGDHATRDDDDTRRYLPDAAWELLDPEERRATDRKKRAAAELIDVTAREARRRVAGMHGPAQLDRAERAERELWKGRKTVLDRIEAQRAADDRRSGG